MKLRSLGGGFQLPIRSIGPAKAQVKGDGFGKNPCALRGERDGGADLIQRDMAQVMPKKGYSARLGAIKGQGQFGKR